MNYILKGYLVNELEAERVRQNRKFPDQHKRLAAGEVNEGLMLGILMEEVGEVAKAWLEDDPANIREELVQVAAVAISWIEGIDAR